MRDVTRLVFVAAILYGGTATTQELEPRFYSNLPPGLNFVALGYARSEGGVLFDPSIELENADLTLDGPFLGYARSIDIGGVSGSFDAGLANVCLSGSADFAGERLTRDVCGWSDARLRLAINFIGAPALSMTEFASYRQDLVVGASLQLVVPSGDYDPDKLVNIGANRWAVRTELGFSKSMRGWLVEGALAGTFYEPNDEFFGGRTRRQDPIFSLQAHVVRRFDSGIWLAVDYTHYRGGETEIDGVARGDLQSNARVGLTFSLPLNARLSIKFNASSGVLTRTGSDFDTAGIAWQYRWGAGL